MASCEQRTPAAEAAWQTTGTAVPRPAAEAACRAQRGCQTRGQAVGLAVARRATWQGPAAEAARAETPEMPATAARSICRLTPIAYRLTLNACRLLLWPIGDLGAGALAFLLALVVRYHVAPALDRRLSILPPHPHLYAAAFALYLVLLVVTLGLAGAYRRPLAWTGPGEYRAVVQAVTFTLLTLLMAMYFVDHVNRVPRGWLLATWVLACALVMGTRLLARVLAGRLAAAGVAGRRVLVVGTHSEALAMEWLLRRQPHLGLRPMRFGLEPRGAHTIVDQAIGDRRQAIDQATAQATGDRRQAPVVRSVRRLTKAVSGAGSHGDV